jgi:hypothetical protein
MKVTNDEIVRRMTYRKPTEETAQLHERVNDICITAAQLLNSICPAGRNLALVLTHLEDARHRANAAIAQDGQAPIYDRIGG